MKFSIEPRQRFEKWISKTLDNYEVVSQSFDTYREAKRFLLQYQIKRMKILIQEYKNILENM